MAANGSANPGGRTQAQQQSTTSTIEGPGDKAANGSANPGGRTQAQQLSTTESTIKGPRDKAANGSVNPGGRAQAREQGGKGRKEMIMKGTKDTAGQHF